MLLSAGSQDLLVLSRLAANARTASATVSVKYHRNLRYRAPENTLSFKLCVDAALGKLLWRKRRAASPISAVYASNQTGWTNGLKRKTTSARRAALQRNVCYRLWSVEQVNFVDHRPFANLARRIDTDEAILRAIESSGRLKAETVRLQHRRPTGCRVPDDYIDPRRHGLFMARSILREARDGGRAC